MATRILKSGVRFKTTITEGEVTKRVQLIGPAEVELTDDQVVAFKNLLEPEAPTPAEVVDEDEDEDEDTGTVEPQVTEPTVVPVEPAEPAETTSVEPNVTPAEPVTAPETTETLELTADKPFAEMDNAELSVQIKDLEDKVKTNLDSDVKQECIRELTTARQILANRT